jgi:hypothetical protein
MIAKPPPKEEPTLPRTAIQTTGEIHVAGVAALAARDE